MLIKKTTSISSYYIPNRYQKGPYFNGAETHVVECNLSYSYIVYHCERAGYFYCRARKIYTLALFYDLELIYKK